MRNFIEKLEEYGLKIYLEPEELLEMAEDVFEDGGANNGEKGLFKRITDYAAVRIDRMEVFKEKFEIPQEYDFIPENVLEECTMEEWVIEGDQSRNVYLEFGHISAALKKEIKEMINKSNNKTINANKKFQFKRKFNPEQAEQELIREIFEGMYEIMKDERTKEPREKFLMEVETALKLDQNIYLVSS